MNCYQGLFPLGIGTNRFSIKNMSDEEGLESAVQLVTDALNAGCSYIDVSSSYSKGFAAEVCKRAFQKTNAPKHIAIKVSYLSDSTAEDVLNRVTSELKKLDVDHASFLVVWNISNYSQFQKIIERGALYDGALQAKKLGLVDHICFSTHASPDDIILILESELFEGVTISYSVLNAQIMEPVLQKAAEKNIGVAVMNPLGGGIIPQNREYYSFLRFSPEESSVQAALRYIHAHPAVDVILSGFSSKNELCENLSAIQCPSTDEALDRRNFINQAFYSLDGFCTGCRYCEDCPKGINIFALMQSYNTILFPRTQKLYGRTEPEIIDAINICSRLKNTFGILPENSINPCISCGKCESHCTAQLPIRERIRWLYQTFEVVCFSRSGMQERIKRLVAKNQNIAFYPGSGYTAYVLELLKETFPNKQFNISLFDSNPNLWGSKTSGYEIFSPEKIENIHPDVVIISNFNYSDEIYEQLEYLIKQGVNVVKLHEKNDVPWVF